jgi:hypothetical protein
MTFGLNVPYGIVTQDSLQFEINSNSRTTDFSEEILQYVRNQKAGYLNQIKLNLDRLNIEAETYNSGLKQELETHLKNMKADITAKNSTLGKL